MNTSSSLPDPSVVAIVEAGRAGGRFTSRRLWIAVTALTVLATCGYVVMRARGGAGPAL